MLKQPSDEAKTEALKHANGYVYVIDKSASEKSNDIPPEAIIGAWKVNEKGIIEGEFIPNPSFRQK